MKFRKTYRIVLLLWFVLGGHGISSSQEIIKALPRWMVTSLVNVNIPQPPVKRFIDHNSLGYQFEFHYRLQYNKPFLAGIFYDEMPLSKYVLTYDQGDTKIHDKAYSRRIEPGFSIGFYPEINWLLQPYLIGRMGLAIFQTSSILKDDDTNESIDRISESTSMAPSYGLDVGLHIVPVIWYLRGDIRFGFSGNPSVDYLILDEENQGTTGYPIDYFVKHTSAGKWMKISAGISYLF